MKLVLTYLAILLLFGALVVGLTTDETTAWERCELHGQCEGYRP